MTTITNLRAPQLRKCSSIHREKRRKKPLHVKGTSGTNVMIYPGHFLQPLKMRTFFVVRKICTGDLISCIVHGRKMFREEMAVG